MNRTEIDWCDMTWNPVVGCTGEGCPGRNTWCYAARVARARTGRLCTIMPTADQVETYGLDPELSLCAQYHPHLHEERLEEPMRRRKPTTIFLCSMCDLWDAAVEPEWRERIMEIIQRTPQHRYIAPTKQPQRLDWMPLGNLCIGTSITAPYERWRQDKLAQAYNGVGPLALSIEPLLMAMGDHGEDWIDPRIDWVIIGGLTGAGARQVTAQMVADIIGAARAVGAQVFVKENLEIWRPREWPQHRYPAWREQWQGGKQMSLGSVTRSAANGS